MKKYQEKYPDIDFSKMMIYVHVVDGRDLEYSIININHQLLYEPINLKQSKSQLKPIKFQFLTSKKIIPKIYHMIKNYDGFEIYDEDFVICDKEADNKTECYESCYVTTSNKDGQEVFQLFANNINLTNELMSNEKIKNFFDLIQKSINEEIKKMPIKDTVQPFSTSAYLSFFRKTK